MISEPAGPRPRRSRWHPLVRQLHLWIGAWGALAAILFGFSGLVLNHRFALELPQGERTQESTQRLEVPPAIRGDRTAVREWLAQAHGLQALTARARPAGGGGPGGSPGAGARPVPDNAAPQPEQWTFSGGPATRGWNDEYVPGEAWLRLETSAYSPVAALSRLHKSAGGGIGWILLGDSFAIAMILLGITGILLWLRGRKPRDMAISVLALSTVVTIVVLGAAYG